MRRAKKLKMEKLRKLKAEAREAERVANTRSKYKPPEFTALKIKVSRFVDTPDTLSVRQLPSFLSKPKRKKKKLVLRPKGWSEREAAAELEIERKKTMVAPLFNKGGYQYVGDAPPEIIQGLGRKL